MNALNAKVLGLVGPQLPKLTTLQIVKNWTQSRNLPTFATKSLHVLAKEKGIRDE
jgi:L-lactate dehydrogenase complex protein LldF